VYCLSETYRKVIDEDVILERMFSSSLFAVAQNHAQSICSFLDVHYETLALDLAVSNYGPPPVL
jgi:hypothetical protein